MPRYIKLIVLIVLCSALHFLTLTPGASLCSDKQRFVIILTTSVTPNIPGRLHNQSVRLHLYLESIHQWLDNTSLPIVVLDSSNYEFHEIKHPNFKYYSFNLDRKYGSQTHAEAYSIMKLYNSSMLLGCEYIFKVTGKYFLPNIDTMLDLVPFNTDIIHTRTIQPIAMGWKNELTPYLWEYLIEGNRGGLEDEVYKFIYPGSKSVYNGNNLTIFKLPLIKLLKPVQRNYGDWMSQF